MEGCALRVECPVFGVWSHSGTSVMYSECVSEWGGSRCVGARAVGMDQDRGQVSVRKVKARARALASSRVGQRLEARARW